jgi:hypothetical protein
MKKILAFLSDLCGLERSGREKKFFAERRTFLPIAGDERFLVF